jgi:hypothetical protein
VEVVNIVNAARIVLSTTVLVAIGRQLSLHLGASHDPVNFFSYFTNLSNLCAALVLLASAFNELKSRTPALDVMRFLSVVNMTVVGVVFSVLLRNEDLGGLLPWINIVLHYVMPCAVVIDWLLSPPAATFKSRHLLLAFAFPAAYLIYVVIRGAASGWYPYPFLNPINVGGYAGVAAYSAGISVIFLLAGWSFLLIDSRRRSRCFTG